MTFAYNYNPEKFKQLSNFKDVKEFNKSYEMYLADHSETFSKRELNFLRVYKRFGAKVFGVVTASIKTIVKAAIDKYNLKTSVRTAKRALKKATSIGLLTLHETFHTKTGCKGPNIAQFNKYQNGTTEEKAKGDNINDEKPSDKSKMALHKTNLTKTIIKKYYIRKFDFSNFTFINKKMTIKSSKVELFVTPVKEKEDFKPLKFISRLKKVIYNSLMNTKKEAKSIIEIVFANVYDLTKFKTYKPMTDSLLEKALRIVEITLNAQKSGTLDHIKYMPGFIDSRIKEELKAVTERQMKKVIEEMQKN